MRVCCPVDLTVQCWLIWPDLLGKVIYEMSRSDGRRATTMHAGVRAMTGEGWEVGGPRCRAAR